MITSSKISTAPCARVSSRSFCRYSRDWLQQAIVGRQRLDDGRGDVLALLRANACSSAAMSPSGITSVSAATCAGTPALSARPCVTTPLPAFTMSESTWP